MVQEQRTQLAYGEEINDRCRFGAMAMYSATLMVRTLHKVTGLLADGAVSACELVARGANAHTIHNRGLKIDQDRASLGGVFHEPHVHYLRVVLSTLASCGSLVPDERSDQALGLVPPEVCGSWPLLAGWDPQFSWAHRQPATHGS